MPPLTVLLLVHGKVTSRVVSRYSTYYVSTKRYRYKVPLPYLNDAVGTVEHKHLSLGLENLVWKAARLLSLLHFHSR